MTDLNLLTQLKNNMVANTKIFLFSILLFITSNFVYANNLTITGLSKINYDDLQTQTSVNLNKNFFTEDDINILLKDLYQSDLIFDLDYKKDGNNHYFAIQENKLIENIFINGNVRINDELIVNNIKLKKNGFINKNRLSEDINIIKNIYSVKGFNKVNVDVSTEKFSSDRVNIIYNIRENKQSQIERIKFQGNFTFSDRYLLSLINTKSKNFYNIFSTGSNLNIESFNFDIIKIKSFYKQKGFFDVNVNFNITETSSNKYTVDFFIEEGYRLKLDDISIDNPESDISIQINAKFDKFLSKLSKNNYYYDQEIIDNFLININKTLINNNVFNVTFVSNLEQNNEINKLIFHENKINPSRINKVSIQGNDITKDKTIRSKLLFEPGDYFNVNSINITKNNLLKLKYINKVDVSNNINDGKSDIIINIEENKRTGQFLAGGTFSGDNGVGVTIAIKDNNIFGSGNSFDTSLSANQENLLFRTSFTQYPLSSSNIKNKYTLFNTETDLSNSFGFQNEELGIGYSTSLSYNEFFDLRAGLSYKKSDRHSPKKSISSINENIGEYDIYSINLSLIQDSLNDFLYPTDGTKNSIYFEYSPKDISDDSYYKLIIKSDLYRKMKNSNRFLFLSNDFGFADSLDGNLSTVNAYSLGGLNFKGFDYRGVGPKQDNIYLGGNKFFTSTIGYGGSFLFDDNDNINTKLFYTLGSIWDSDYTNKNKFDIRSSIGISFDILTAVGPVSLIYAKPIDKNTNDITNEFNFSIGTSF